MKIPATVITGFLGAGKTTLIRHLLQNAGGRRIALVINEFGDLGVDREVINGCAIEGCAEDDVVELANGCICCTVADDFLPTMEMLLDRPEPPDHIVIETSGLALPKPLVKAFTWPEIRARVTVDGVIAVVDAPAVAAGTFAHDPNAVAEQREADDNLDHHSPLEEVFEDQLLAADMVLLNKADLVDADAMAGVRKVVESELPRAVKIVEARHGTLDASVLLGLQAGAEDDLDARPSHHEDHDEHDHDDFESFEVVIGGSADPDALKSRIEAAARDHGILRVKGFVHVEGKPRRHVIQGVGARIDGYYDRPWADGEAKESRLVVIGLHGLDRAAVTRALAG
ncbi:MAG: cobalamin biosynthesis protein CobW [Rhodospirillaceae bacterium]|nr:cobalamin biosynthesis protein CobW [Rhodospirillaceae bacterium]